MTGDDPGFLQARLDAFGPFVEVRWGQRWGLRVRAQAWAEFVLAVHRGRYVPERVPVRPDWVRARIEERFDGVAPMGWQPKVFEVPNLVWERFVNGVRAGAFAELAVLLWSGVPAAALRAPVNGRAGEDDAPVSDGRMPDGWLLGRVLGVDEAGDQRGDVSDSSS
ncbi:hypothetical protein [Nonomuraea sp. KM90]|uniref:hypothetical protein n=1 Tax=Nonomuraea sp. KM90 TaxID=3457428 RepID=UPI003FCDE00B